MHDRDSLGSTVKPTEATVSDRLVELSEEVSRLEAKVLPGPRTDETAALPERTPIGGMRSALEDLTARVRRVNDELKILF